MDIREEKEKIQLCADAIVDYIAEQMISQRVHDEFGDGLGIGRYVELADKVYEEIKLRM